MLSRAVPGALRATTRAVSGRAAPVSKFSTLAVANRIPAALVSRNALSARNLRWLSVVGGDGSDSDFAPKKKEAPAPSGDRAVQDEIKDMVTQRKVVLFMKGTPDFPMCGFSNRAVQILDHHKTTYGAFNVLEDPEVREGIKQYS